MITAPKMLAILPLLIILSSCGITSSYDLTRVLPVVFPIEGGQYRDIESKDKGLGYIKRVGSHYVTSDANGVFAPSKYTVMPVPNRKDFFIVQICCNEDRFDYFFLSINDTTGLIAIYTAPPFLPEPYKSMVKYGEYGFVAVKELIRDTEDLLIGITQMSNFPDPKSKVGSLEPVVAR